MHMVDKREACTHWLATLGTIPCFGRHRESARPWSLASDSASLNYLNAPHSTPAAECLSMSIANIQCQTSFRLVTAVAGFISVLAPTCTNFPTLVTLGLVDIEGDPFASKASSKATTLHRTATSYETVCAIAYSAHSRLRQLARNASFAQSSLHDPNPLATLQTPQTRLHIA
jgi:hypothetical protein